jgi:hypothetical protein
LINLSQYLWQLIIARAAKLHWLPRKHFLQPIHRRRIAIQGQHPTFRLNAFNQRSEVPASARGPIDKHLAALWPQALDNFGKEHRNVHGTSVQ